MLGQAANLDALTLQQRLEQSQHHASLNAALYIAKNNLLEYYYKNGNMIIDNEVHSPNVSDLLLLLSSFIHCHDSWIPGSIPIYDFING